MPNWNWDEQADDEGMVHQSVADTDNDDATKLKQGYDYANFSEITPDPVACYPLHEDGGSTAYDVAGGNDGTVSGATVNVEGLLGTTAYSFDGTDDYVDIGDTVHADNISLGLWYSVDSVPSSGTIRPLNKNDEWGVRLQSDGWDAFTYHGGSADILDSGVTPTTGDWHLLVFTYDGADQRLYHDASQIASATTNSGAIDDSTASIRIGSTSGGGDYWNGDIGPVYLWTSALTQAQIQTLYDVVAAPGDWLGSGKLL
jgi:hypothetical protein